MKKMELELKILDINKEEFIKKIEELGAVFKEQSRQFLYTYDLPSIYGRYIDLVTQLNNPENQIKYETTIEKFKLFAFEFDNMLNNNQINELHKITGYNKLASIPLDNIATYLNDENLTSFMKQFHNNSKKWIRVRQTGDKATIAVKHILADNNSGVQQMLETEIDVPSVKEADTLLEALGFSHKSYQEKERITYMLFDREIDIDTWPFLPTYFEIEGESQEDLTNVLNKLGYSFEDAVSCTADEIYAKIGIIVDELRELRFED